MMSFLVSLILGLLRWAFEPSKYSVKEGAGPGALEERLRVKLKEEGW